MTAVRAVTVAPEEAELRLDRWFRQHYPDLGHGRLEKLLRTGQVRIDGKRAKSGTRLAAGLGAIPGPGAGKGGTRTTWPATSRVPDLARLPSIRTWPVRSNFSRRPWPRLG